MFSMGVAERRTPEERRRHQRQEEQRRRRILNLNVQSTPQPHCSQGLFYRGWNLLPKEHFTNKGLYFSMSFDYPSFAQRYAHFMNFRLWIGKPRGQQEECQAIQTEAREKFFFNQKLRFQFKRIVSMYLVKKLQLKNETDPVTMEQPIQAVFLYDHANRCKFRFEAKELLRDFSTRLLTHEDLFPTPLFLRNPFTNSKLHLGQLLSLYTQIKSFGQMHWTLECLQDAQFIMKLFKRDNIRKLRLSALHHLMKSPQGSDFLLEFIETQHDILDKPYDLRTYTWALKTNKCHFIERIHSWKVMCFAFYEIEITEEDIFERHRKISKLTPVVLKLCTPCVEIVMVKRNSAGLKP